ncbi:MAG: hypothetical protein LN414_03270 [Candidatus Thermoplasmatota archaeon]|nr:hypothetical protein [Candidatus Thermoplasmatota archaeon]
MPMSEHDWERMDDVHKEFRESIGGKVDKTDCKDNHTKDAGLSRAVQKNTTDITWLKKFHAAEVTIAGSVIAAIILWAAFGGG